MKTPLVSISCITYNHAAYITECLEGFLSQITNFKIEILIHDDASTDDTRRIIERYAEQYPHMIFPIFQKENQFSKGQRGFMIQYNFPRARGKYVALCEGDDFWADPYKLQKQVDFLEQNREYSFCFHAFNVLRGQEIVRKEPGYSQPFDVKQWNIVWHLYNRTCTTMIRKDALPLKVPDELTVQMHGDIYTTAFAAFSGKGRFMPDVMATYREHDQGIATSLNPVEKYKKSLMTRKLLFYHLKLTPLARFVCLLAMAKYIVAMGLAKMRLVR